MNRLLALLALAALAAQPARADLITYTWDDRGSNSGFGGGFTVDTARMTPAAGGLMRFDDSAITASGFFFSRGLPAPVTFGIVGVTPGDYLIDPTDGAIHSGARLNFGPSTVLPNGYQVTGGGATFYSGVNSFVDIQFAYLGDNVPPDGEFLASVGKWNPSVEVSPIPAPPAVLLAAAGAALLAGRRLSSLRRGAGRVEC